MAFDFIKQLINNFSNNNLKQNTMAKESKPFWEYTKKSELAPLVQTALEASKQMNEQKQLFYKNVIVTAAAKFDQAPENKMELCKTLAGQCIAAAEYGNK